MAQERLPTKPSVDAPPERATAKGRIKSKRALPAQAVRGKMRLKPKAVRDGAAAPRDERKRDDSLPDQSGLTQPEDRSDRYVRLRVRVEDGRMSILDSAVVDSALVQPPAIHGDFAYEVSEGERRLHVDAIPDLGVIRGFVNPDGPPEERQHHTYEQSVYEFAVRVPIDKLASAALPRVAIVLYRVKERRPQMILTERPIAVEYEREIREVSRLDGIPPKALPAAVRPSRRKSRRAK